MQRMSDKDKALAIKMRESGYGFQEISDQLGFSVSSIWNYLKDKEIGDISIKEKKELTAENERLKRTISKIISAIKGGLDDEK